MRIMCFEEGDQIWTFWRLAFKSAIGEVAGLVADNALSVKLVLVAESEVIDIMCRHDNLKTASKSSFHFLVVNQRDFAFTDWIDNRHALKSLAANCLGYFKAVRFALAHAHNEF